ncbi:MAG: mandelate racemase/muconate lactonizing enzyme family protein [Rhodospirillales bacterium]
MIIVSKELYVIPIKHTGGEKISHRGTWVLLRLETGAGFVGWGEGSDSRDEENCIALIEDMAEALVGTDIDPKTYAQQLAREAPPERMPRTARSCIAQALTDIAAQSRHGSVAMMLTGGAEIATAVPVYANINRKVKIRTPEMTAAAGLETIKAGIQRIKFAPFDEVSPDALEKEGEKIVEPGVARLEALRAAIGPEPDLMLDLHWRFTPKTVPLLAEIARQFNVSWIEDPLPVFDPSDLAELRKLSGAMITGGEALFTYQDLEALTKSGAIDLLIADVKYVGGTMELDRVCKMAASHGVAFAPHNPSGPVSTAASAHVVAANPNADVLEYSFGEVPWRYDVAEGETLKNGRLTVAGPGYGITIHPEKASKPA